MEGRIITSDLLENVRQQQIERNISWTMDNGYMSFVTGDRDWAYWRFTLGSLGIRFIELSNISEQSSVGA
ncbi:hypothetical protein ASPCAL13043 [Aspergillus calidoustus]|uniref:Uncharacterized protein n=1 Tax=Aspergillus calidoustus TaxID=454130 RepID=A0A0U5GDK8_ASPCI|nr:hypothetical protein ASPCAL13043 [Aspergillus calidoustus]